MTAKLRSSSAKTNHTTKFYF